MNATKKPIKHQISFCYAWLTLRTNTSRTSASSFLRVKAIFSPKKKGTEQIDAWNYACGKESFLIANRNIFHFRAHSASSFQIIKKSATCPIPPWPASKASDSRNSWNNLSTDTPLFIHFHPLPFCRLYFVEMTCRYCTGTLPVTLPLFATLRLVLSRL